MRKAFLLVVLACVAGAAPAPAAEQAKRERILFSRTYPTTGGEDEIRAVAPAGGPSARLGHASFGASSPDASPDGTKIAFETSLPGHDSIYVMDSDGRNARRLLVDPQATMQEPAWSPNGRMIAYVRGQDLWVARADGTQRRLVAANGSSPTWSPDGRRIAFVRGHHIFVVSLAGGEPAQLTATEYEDDAPAWSPRGDEIAFERFDFPESSGHARLYVMNGDGSGQRLLLADDEPARHPSWSPDGLRLVFARGTFEQEQLYIVDANGLGLRRLTTSGARDTEPDWGFAAPPDEPPSRGDELLPDLDQRAPSGLTVTQTHGRFLLGFVSATDNVGRGPVWYRGSRANRAANTMAAHQLVRLRSGKIRVYRDVGVMRYTWSSSHSHWHLLRFQGYELRRASDFSVVVRDRKSGFCLADHYGLARHRVRNFTGARFFANCAQGRPHALAVEQGTSIGFTDRYPAHFHGQNVDITRVPAGIYVLVHRADPLGRVREETRGNNAASLRLRLTWPRGLSRAPRIRVLRVCEGSERCDARR